MATYRIGIGSFSLAENGGVGIGTDSAGLGNLKVEGTVKTTDLDVTGVSTFQRYAGFAADDLNIVRDTSLSGEHSTLGDIVVGVNSIFTVSTGATVTVGAVESVSIGTHFSPPTGGVEDRPEVPVEGTVRFNTDLNTLEFYNGVDWRQFNISGNSGRGFSTNGDRTTPSIDQINISTKGNAISKHYSTLGRNGTAGCSNSTRGLLIGGSTPTKINSIEYITMASSGDALDFGDALANYGVEMSACASSTRGLFGGGYYHPSVRSNVMQYVEINTLGNAIDFGDLTSIMVSAASLSSPTRAIFWGGYRTSPGAGSDIDTVTIASKGNSVDFGSGDSVARTSGCSNGTRGMVGGGRADGAIVGNSINYITIASTGNATYFGDLTINRVMPGGCSSHTRAVWMGGYNHPVYPRTIDYVEFATQGNALDFGEASKEDRHSGGFSDCHGGLGGY